MKWSQLKKRVEAMFADSVAGRVEVWNTRYRKSHDAEGEAWNTIDTQRFSSMGTYTYFVQSGSEANRLRRESGCTDFRDPAQRERYYQACDEADKIVHDRGIFASWDVNRALFDYLNLSIDDAVKSDNPIIRAFATLDRRFGKRCLKEFDDSREHPLVKTLYRFRCEVEAIKTEPEQRHAADANKSGSR
jgi:hypothetical protein